jgi:hypothetical protein
MLSPSLWGVHLWSTIDPSVAPPALQLRCSAWVLCDDHTFIRNHSPPLAALADMFRHVVKPKHRPAIGGSIFDTNSLHSFIFSLHDLALFSISRYFS